MSELRTSTRVQPLIIRTKFRLDGAEHEAYVTNLSDSGAFLATENLVPVGERIALTMELPARLGQVRAEARIVWRTDEVGSRAKHMPVGMGLMFVGLEEEDRSKIQSYIERFTGLAEQLGRQTLT